MSCTTHRLQELSSSSSIKFLFLFLWYKNHNSQNWRILVGRTEASLTVLGMSLHDWNIIPRWQLLDIQHFFSELHNGCLFSKHVTALSHRNRLFLLFFFALGGILSFECREDHSWEKGWADLLESLEICWSGFTFQLHHFPVVWLQASCCWPSAFSPVMGILVSSS